MISQRESRWAEFTDSNPIASGQTGVDVFSKTATLKRSFRDAPRQKELQPLVPSSREGQVERRESNHVNAWASPRSSGGTPNHGANAQKDFPEQVQLKFRSSTATSTNDVIWCPLTQMWHCRLGAELVISLIAGVMDVTPDSPCGSAEQMRSQGDTNDRQIRGNFTLSLSTLGGNISEEDSQLRMERDLVSHAFSSTWIGRSCGQTDFHAKWIDEQKPLHPLQSKRNIRVFANAASLCVHPTWQDADPSCTELVDVKSEPTKTLGSASPPSWLVCCQLQLRDSQGQNLRCPSRVPAMEAAGPSFGGMGPDMNRWKLAVPGCVTTLVKSEVDIKRGLG